MVTRAVNKGGTVKQENWSIWKYSIPLNSDNGLHGDVFEIKMLQGARVLSVGIQKGCPVMWVIVAVNRAKVTRRFLLCSTGQPLMKHPDLINFVGTILLLNDNFVLHVFTNKI